jgi:virulence-associated protein VapD
VQTLAPSSVSKTIHTTPVQTSAPSSVSQTIHAPPPPPVPTIVISPHIQIIIQNIKYSQRRSNAHLDNLFRRIKLYNDEYKLYKQLTIARLHLIRHYNALYYDIKHVLEKHDMDDTDDKSYNKKTVKNIPHFIRSMHTLNASIKKIEQSIQFIKGNHKYILLRILNKLKIQYQEDTQKLFEIINHY